MNNVRLMVGKHFQFDCSILFLLGFYVLSLIIRLPFLIIVSLIFLCLKDIFVCFHK